MDVASVQTFEDSVLGRISSRSLFAGGEKVLLAVSGGADSVAMACALHRLQQTGRLDCRLVIGHVNHGLRGEQSDLDAAFVADLGKRLAVETVAAVVDTPAAAQSQKLSIETAARVLRLKQLVQMAESRQCSVIVTAHHADDLAETLIHRLMRGTGFRGLCGIRSASCVYGMRFVRPLLGLRRAAILQYCRQQDLSWREDASNASLAFTRNRIRHRLLPVLEGDSTGLVDRLCNLSDAAERLLKATGRQAETIFKQGRRQIPRQVLTLDRDDLTPLTPWVRYEVFRRVLVELAAGLGGYTQRHFEAMAEMAAQPQARGDFPGGVCVSIDGGQMTFCRTDAVVSSLLPEGPVPVEIGGCVSWGPWHLCCRQLRRSDIDFEAFLKTKDRTVEWFDADKISGPLLARRRCDGDRFRPIGGWGEKKVARFLMDAGLDASVRRDAFVVTDAEKILWVAPVRMSGQAGVDADTKTILEVRLQK